VTKDVIERNLDFVSKRNEKINKIKEDELRSLNFVPTMATRKDKKENAIPSQNLSVADRLFKNA